MTDTLIWLAIGGLLGASLFMFGFWTGRDIGRDQGEWKAIKSMIDNLRVGKSELEAEIRRVIDAHRPREQPEQKNQQPDERPPKEGAH